MEYKDLNEERYPSFESQRMFNDFTREFLDEIKWTRQIMVVIMFTLIVGVMSTWGLHCQ